MRRVDSVDANEADRESRSVNLDCSIAVSELNRPSKNFRGDRFTVGVDHSTECFVGIDCDGNSISDFETGALAGIV